MTDEQLIEECNELAQKLYYILGYRVGSDYKMYKATHPHEVMCWQMAVEAYNHIAETDIEDALIAEGYYE